jgi:hypothetical protein
LVQRSRTLSGIGFGLLQMMSWRKYQPSARSAKASIHGTPIKSFGFRPGNAGALRGTGASSRRLEGIMARLLSSFPVPVMASLLPPRPLPA